MVRLLGIILNLGLIGVLFVLIDDWGMPKHSTQIALVVLMVATPLFNLAFLSGLAGRNGEKGLFGLYLERKSLEERQKIADLKK